MVHAQQEHGLTERRACGLAHQPCGTQRYLPTQREDEDRLTQAIIALDSQYGRYGYRQITALLQRDGWRMDKDRVEHIWRCEGPKVPQRQKPRGRLWFNNGSCVRLRPTHKNHVWSYDFVSTRTQDGTGAESELRDGCATLTKLLGQNIGQATAEKHRLSRARVVCFIHDG